MKQDKPELFIYMSDQHAARMIGCMGHSVVKTPNLDRIAAQGTMFTNAYTTCPICVPSRVSFMTGKAPEDLNVYCNEDSFDTKEITLAHSLSNVGYETVLCGRMHFIGMDQRHGFDKRIAHDISPMIPGFPSEEREDLGAFGKAMYQKWALDIIGDGVSPMQSYDEYVIRQGIQYLQQDHEKPQMIVMGTYLPHSPYIVEKQKFDYYYDLLEDIDEALPISLDLSFLEDKRQYPKGLDQRKVLAAYYGMIEQMDQQIGLAYDSFLEYLKRTNKKGIFIYMSDHGDQVGNKNFFGKQTFFEDSVKIPVIMSGDSIGKGIVNSTVCSITDITETICCLGHGKKMPQSCGTNLLCDTISKNSGATSFFVDRIKGEVRIGHMLRQGKYKYIYYYVNKTTQQYLFDLEKDPDERVDLSKKLLDICDTMKKQIDFSKDAQYATNFNANQENGVLLSQWGAAHRELNTEMYLAPKESRVLKESSKRDYYDNM